MSSAPDKDCQTGCTADAGGTIKVIVFDFDGTLVQSNLIKSQAWHDLFAGDAVCRAVLPTVLRQHGEASRYIIIGKVWERAFGENFDQELLPGIIADYARRYNQLVSDRVKMCPEMPGASETIQNLFAKVPLYCSSQTPETELQTILHHRGWSRYFKGMYGYPRIKRETVERIMSAEQVFPEELLVVGDGESDREAAEKAGARFFPVVANTDLRSLLKLCGE